MMRKSLFTKNNNTPENSINLINWVSSNLKEYSKVAISRNIDETMVNSALAIVHKFIAERNLILFGGLAIDYALRLKGSSIYPDDQTPDYDCLSPNNVEAAYDLADILHNIGFNSVAVVRGIHVQTMRVRVDFNWVADFGYTPLSVYEQIPTFSYKNIRIVHPDYQRIDMHLAFCYPFNASPREDIFHRWAKDLQRLNLFESYYKITLSEIESKSTIVQASLDIDISSDILALHGFAAYATIRNSLTELITKVNYQVDIKAPILEISILNANTIRVELPVGDKIIIATPYPEKVVSNATRYYPVMEAYPESFHIKNLIVLSSKKRLLAATRVRIGDNQVYIVSIQYLLLWFLFQSFRCSPQERLIYRNYYTHTMEIIKIAEDVYASFINKVEDDISAREDIVNNFQNSPFAPIITTIGDINHNNTYTILMANNAARVKDIPPSSLNLDSNLSEILLGLPSNYYPDGIRPRPKAVYDHVLYQTDGSLIPVDIT